MLVAGVPESATLTGSVFLRLTRKKLSQPLDFYTFHRETFFVISNLDPCRG